MASLTSASQTTQVMELLARLDPRLWEIFHPHVPTLAQTPGVHSLDRGSEVALNPQPLPPVEALRLATHKTSVAIAEATIAANLSGRKPGDILQDIGDELCPRPPKIPWPKKWPLPVQLQEPFPIDPRYVGPAVQATAGVVFQAYADRTADEALSAAFGQLADRLVDAALKTANSSS